MKMKENPLEEQLERTLYFAIGLEALDDSEMSHIILGPSNETSECVNLSSKVIQVEPQTRNLYQM